MCGIAGVFDTRGAAVDPVTIDRMTRSLAHRGPNGEGLYTEGPIALGHRRLAIIDLSSAAEQPMSNETGDIVIVFNGEIYNYQKLRTELTALGHAFASRSDTEVIVHGYEQWGEGVVDRLNGMFAFAIWDARDSSLFVARDRYGIKPLYYTFADGRFLFGSEVKALLEAFDWNRQVDPRALVEYFTFQNVLSDRTLFSGVRMLPAAHRARVRAGDTTLSPERWWDYDYSASAAIGFEEAKAETRRLVEAAVSRQLMSDVPLGSYLSGGMDSGSLVALAGRAIPNLMTFTGGFDLTLAQGIEQNFDERAAAEQMASLFRTDHYETVLHPGSMERVLPELVWHLEDLRVGMCYQNYYIAHLASKFVRVCLSGGGGDEMFAGYPWRYLPLVSTASAAEFDDASFAAWQRLIPAEEHGEFFSAETLAAVSESLVRDAYAAVLEGAPGSDGEWSPATALDREMYFEANTFLHGLLVVEDKISSAHALEARVPFLDNDLVDFTLTLPADFKLNLKGLLGGDAAGIDGATLQSSDGKYVLRAAMEGLLPEDILLKKKQGFSTPDGSWYRGDSMGYVRETLLSNRCLGRGYFRPDYIRRVVDEHANGEQNHRLLLWSLLSFEWWNRVFVDADWSPAR